MKILVTGISGLVGSEAVEHFDRQGHEVYGVDNNMRREFFGPGDAGIGVRGRRAVGPIVREDRPQAGDSQRSQG